MRHSLFPGLLLSVLMTGFAAAQTPEAAVHAACKSDLIPAATTAADKKKNQMLDCPCMSGFLIARLGASDAKIIMRMYSASAAKSTEQLNAIKTELGDEAIAGVMKRVGNIIKMGREIDKACPPIPAR